MNGIQKIRFEGIDKDTELRFLKPTSYRHAVNCRVGSTEKGGLGGVENVQGNLIRPNPLLPTGDNICIGTLGDQKNARLVIWYWNSLGNHTIQTYDTLSATFSLIVQWSGLNFDRAYFITGAEIVEEQVYWTDGLNDQRKINLARPYTVGSPPTDESELSLYKRPPLEQIGGLFRVTEVAPPTQNVNYISDKNYQFSYRYVYEDNEKSALAPYSKITLGETYPNLSSTDRYRIRMTLPIEDSYTGIKRIEVARRVGNEGNWGVFHKIDINPILNTISGAESLVDYHGNENIQTLSDSEAQKIFDTVPFFSRGLAMVKSRVFLTSDAEGLEAVDDISLVINPTLSSGSALHQYTHKSNGSYNFGLVYYNKDGLFSGVLGKKFISFPISLADAEINNGDKFRVSVDITGSIPEWAHSYQLVRTEEQYYQVYAQYPVNVFFYVGTPSADNTTDDLAVLRFDGKDYRLHKRDEYTKFAKIHLQMPRTVPFVPDTDTYVRILTKNSLGEQMSEVVERVQEVIGDMLVVGDFGIGQNWNNHTLYDTHILVEVFKASEANTNIFYEIAERALIINPETPTRSLEKTTFSGVGGDTIVYYTSIDSEVDGNASFRVLKSVNTRQIGYQYPNKTEDGLSGDTNDDYRLETSSDYRIETPVSIRTIGLGSTESPQSEGGDYNGVVPDTPPGYIGDYAKSDSDIGRANAELDENITFNRNGTIRYSDPFVQDSNINGLSSFSSGNQYPLPYERHQITKLIRVGRVLLAIHEDVTTALYIGEAFMKQNDEFVLVKTDNIIGDDRILSGDGEFGTINPESVVEYEGQAFWWDMINGVVVNYTKAGLFPISSYGMNRFFQEKAKRLLTWLRFIDPAEAARFKIVGGYDPEYDEYALTFPPFDGNEGETWVYNVNTKRWMGTMSFIPQNYGKVANTLFSFGSDGNMYQHNANTLYNNFYGIQYGRSLRFVINEKPNKVKRFTGFHLNVAKMSDGETTGDYQVVKAYTPEGQETYIPGYEFIKKEHLYRSHILRDINSANVPTNAISLRNGDEMRSQVLEVEVSSDVKDSVNRMIESNVVYVESEYSM